VCCAQHRERLWFLHSHSTSCAQRALQAAPAHASHRLLPACLARRKPLDQRFAVLLMRSSYEAVDQLDFIPMVGAGGGGGWRVAVGGWRMCWHAELCAAAAMGCWRIWQQGRAVLGIC
jgi:hypothetical protein